jgi:hypothetical protein
MCTLQLQHASVVQLKQTEQHQSSGKHAVKSRIGEDAIPNLFAMVLLFMVYWSCNPIPWRLDLYFSLFLQPLSNSFAWDSSFCTWSSLILSLIK